MELPLRMSGLHPILLCSECGSVGGTDAEVAECPNCRLKSLNTPRQAPPRPRIPQPKFHTASRLRLDVENNSLTVDIGERVCLIGNCSTTDFVLLPCYQRGGFGSSHVIVIDAGYL